MTSALTLGTAMATAATFLVGPLATAAPAFDVPRALSSDSAVARRLVAVDLIKLQAEEVATASRQAPKGLTLEKQNIFISEALGKKNERLFKELDEPIPASARTTADGLRSITRAQADEIRKMFSLHPVVGDLASARYDTPLQQVGYCFGKATFAHWELLRRGVRAASIGKLFAIGGLLFEGRPWQFHVATIVRGREGGWLVIDALQDRTMTPDEWAKAIMKWSMGGDHPQVRFYMTDPVKFRPIAGAYDEESLGSLYYKGYFTDLRKWFEGHPATMSESFVLLQ